MASADLADLTLRGPAYEWALWSTTVRLAVADPHHLPAAKRLVDRELARVELAASRFARTPSCAAWACAGAVPPGSATSCPSCSMPR